MDDGLLFSSFFLLFFFLAVARNRFSFKSLIGAARAGSLTEALSEVRAHDKRSLSFFHKCWFMLLVTT